LGEGGSKKQARNKPQKKTHPQNPNSEKDYHKEKQPCQNGYGTCRRVLGGGEELGRKEAKKGPKKDGITKKLSIFSPLCEKKERRAEKGGKKKCKGGFACEPGKKKDHRK